MTQNRNALPHNIYIPPTMMTWEEFHSALHDSPRLYRNYKYWNQRIKNQFGDALNINPLESHPYLSAFKALRQEDARQQLPDFRSVLNTTVNEGNYQTVADIYNVIAEGTADGWGNRYGKVSQAFVLTMINTNSHGSHGGPEAFLKIRGYDMKTLITRAADYNREKIRLTEGKHFAELEKLQKMEANFIATLKQAEPKRAGKTAHQMGAHLEQTSLARGIIKKKLSIKKTLAAKSQAVPALPPELANLPSIRKHPLPFFGQAQQPTAATQLTGKKRSRDNTADESNSNKFRRTT